MLSRNKNILIWELHSVKKDDIIRGTMKQNPTSIRSRIVLLFTKPVFHSHRERIAGVYAAAIERGWQVQQIAEPPTKERISRCMRLWSPIGGLIDPSVMTASFDISAFKRLNTVLMGRGMAKLQWQKFDCSFQNCREPVNAAFATLSELSPKGFAFVGDPARPYWSVERGRFFREAVADTASLSEYTGPHPNMLRGRRAMAKWLRSLPLPCGCFLAADHVAASFYAAAAEARLKIGTDLPTIGVDNDECICRSLSPTLSSIQLDFFRSGVNAIQLLENRLADPGRPPMTASYGILGVVRRESTATTYSDHRLSKAMKLIAEHGCEKLSVCDVSREMKCSSRLAEKLFRKHVGTSILDAIRRVRLEKAYSLLRNQSIQIDAIPFQCGYAGSPAYLKTYFKRVTGFTMREWRRQNRIG